MPEQHQGQAGIIDRQRVEGVEPEQQADRADHAGRDGARGSRIRKEAVDADEHQDKGDIRVGDDREKLG